MTFRRLRRLAPPALPVLVVNENRSPLLRVVTSLVTRRSVLWTAHPPGLVYVLAPLRKAATAAGVLIPNG